MQTHFSRRTRWIVSSVISVLAAGSGIVALVSYLHTPALKLKELHANCWVWPQEVAPGGVVTISVKPSAQNEILIPEVAVSISNFSSIDDETTGSWVEESRGFTDAAGVFRLSFTVPSSSHWKKTEFTVYVSKDGYRMDREEVHVYRK